MKTWAFRIILLYGSFVLLMLFLVWRSVNQHFDLVHPDYYQQGIAYETQIQAQQRANALPHPPTLSAQPGYIHLHFPPQHTPTAGQLHMYYPKHAQADFNIPLALDTAGNQHIPTTHLPPGFWRAQLTWTHQGQTHARQFPIVLAPAPAHIP